MGIFRRRPKAELETRADASFNFDGYLRQLMTQFSFNGQSYIVGDPLGKAASAFGSTSPVFSLVMVRMLVFAEVRFAWQRFSGGRAGELFGSSSLALLERPWVGATTGDLLSRMEYDASVYGNSYWVVEDGDLVRLDPCKVTVLTGSYTEPLTGQMFGERLVGYVYKDPLQKTGIIYPPDAVAHYRPVASGSSFVGQSWIASVLPDVCADDEMTKYKQALLRNSATPNVVVQLQAGVSPEQFQATMDVIESAHTGAVNGFKTLYVGAGVDVKTLGLNFEQLSFKATQGAGETRLAAAAGVPAAIVGFSEGLQGSSLNAGNYGAARRRFADGTMRPLWRAAAGALQTLVSAPGSDVRLWFDDRDVSFLQEDVMDAAEIRSRDALTIESFVRSGFVPDTAVEAVRTGDYTKLKHTGLYSVQLQPPGSATPAAVPARQLELPPAPTELAAVSTRTSEVPPDMHIHLPESTTVELRHDDELRDLVRRLAAEQRMTVEDMAAALGMAMGALPAPQVTVNTPEVTVENRVEVAPTPVTVQGPIVPAPEVTVIPAENGTEEITFKRDSTGRIISAKKTPA